MINALRAIGGCVGLAACTQKQKKSIFTYFNYPVLFGAGVTSILPVTSTCSLRWYDRLWLILDSNVLNVMQCWADMTRRDQYPIPNANAMEYPHLTDNKTVAPMTRTSATPGKRM